MAHISYDTAQLKKIADFVSGAQPKLEKFAAIEREFAAKAPQVVDTLVSQGVLSPHQKSAMVKRLIDNPVEVLAMLSKTASLVGHKPMGESDVKSAAAVKETANDVFERRILG